MESKRYHGNCSRNTSNDCVSRLNRVTRREILAKKKVIQELIDAAHIVKDHIAFFPSFRHYDRNGLSAYMESGRGDKLSIIVKNYIQNLLKKNMEGHYGSEWPVEEKVKRREMVAPEARYIFVHEVANTSFNEKTEMLIEEKNSTNCVKSNGPLVGFVHYRFTLEEDIPVLYVFELQLDAHVQGKGLGMFLMQLIELIAHKNGMGAVVLTVQKDNLFAMNFYINKMRYNISTTSPSKVNPMIGVESSYEILCKTFNEEAKTTLEDPG